MLNEVAGELYQRLYRSLLEHAAQAGRGLLLRATVAAQHQLQRDLARMESGPDRDLRQQGVKLLALHTSPMSDRFVHLLMSQFRPSVLPGSRAGDVLETGLNLDQLGLMDEVQVQERVEIARSLHQLMRLVEMPLAEFNTYLSALIGLNHVVPERNVLRPESFVLALLQLMKEFDVPTLVWLAPISESLGEGLTVNYRHWSAILRSKGVKPIGVVEERVPEPPKDRVEGAERSHAASRRVWTPAYRETVLTLDRLRQLMTVAPEGQSEPSTPLFTTGFVPFGSSASVAEESVAPSDFRFERTVPAALDALQEMQQVDEMAKRMRLQPVLHANSSTSVALREQLIQQSTSMSQVLSLEVVSMMLDRLVTDGRLLAPVRSVLERLEPALLRLVLVDPRFFMDRQHPARRLLQEVPQKGLAFCSVDDPDFSHFMRSLQRHLGPLTSSSVEGREPFEIALTGLLREWDDPATRTALATQISSAVVVLSYAEKRNELAELMAKRLRSMSVSQNISPAVLDFLTGPWSVVMAEAQLKDSTGSDDPGGHKALVSDLLWSAQPELTRRDVDRLTKLVGRLLSGLREGLRLIGYPSVKTSAFFDVLMKLHQQAFRSGGVEPIAPSPPGLASSLLDRQENWVGPAEAKASGFMVFPDEIPAKSIPNPPIKATKEELKSAINLNLDVGAWIELHNKGTAQRLQLSWVSPQRTMYLFTSARGKTQSMSQRLLDRLVTEGKLRLVSDRSTVLDAALDNVVHSALLNSLDFNV